MTTIFSKPTFLIANGVLPVLIHNASSEEISALAMLNSGWRNCVVYSLSIELKRDFRASLEKILQVVADMKIQEKVNFNPFISEIEVMKPKSLLELRSSIIRIMEGATFSLCSGLPLDELAELKERAKFEDGTRFAQEITTCAFIGMWADKHTSEKDELHFQNKIFQTLCKFPPGFVAHKIAYLSARACNVEGYLPLWLFENGFRSWALRQAAILPYELQLTGHQLVAIAAAKKSDYRFALEAISKVSPDETTRLTHNKLLTMIQSIAVEADDYDVIERIAIELAYSTDDN